MAADPTTPGYRLVETDGRLTGFAAPAPPAPTRRRRRSPRSPLRRCVTRRRRRPRHRRRRPSPPRRRRSPTRRPRCGTGRRAGAPDGLRPRPGTSRPAWWWRVACTSSAGYRNAAWEVDRTVRRLRPTPPTTGRSWARCRSAWPRRTSASPPTARTSTSWAASPATSARTRPQPERSDSRPVALPPGRRLVAAASPRCPSPAAPARWRWSGATLHLLGGNLADRVTNVGDHHTYDLDTGTWGAAAALPDPRDHLSSVVLDGRIYVLGGEHGHDALQRAAGRPARLRPRHRHLAPAGRACPWPRATSRASTLVSGGADRGGRRPGGQLRPHGATCSPTTRPPTAGRRRGRSCPAARQGAAVHRIGAAIVVTVGAERTDEPQSTTWIGPLD